MAMVMDVLSLSSGGMPRSQSCMYNLAAPPFDEVQSMIKHVV